MSFTSIRKSIFAFSVLLLSISIAQQANAQFTLSFGNLDLLPNTADQEIQLFVSGGGAVSAARVNIMVDDGGPSVGGGSLTTNFITGIDIIDGTIFETNNTGPSGSTVTADGVAFTGTTTTGTSTVVADGLLATLTVDTTTISAGSFSISSDNGPSFQGPTDFPTITGTLVPTQASGTINIVAVPEPGSCGLLALGSLALIQRRRRAV